MEGTKESQSRQQFNSLSFSSTTSFSGHQPHPMEMPFQNSSANFPVAHTPTADQSIHLNKKQVPSSSRALPPSPFSQISVSNSQKVGFSNSRTVSSHSRSSSQPPFFSLDLLPPISPLQHPDPLPTTLTTSMDICSEVDNSSLSRPPPSPSTISSRSHDSLPPRRGHRRSSSDVSFGFSTSFSSPSQFVQVNQSRSYDGFMTTMGNMPCSTPVQSVKLEVPHGGDEHVIEGMGERKSEGEMVDDLFTTYMNLDKIDALNSSIVEDREASGTKTSGAESSDDEAVSSSMMGSLGNSVLMAKDGDQVIMCSRSSGDPVPRHSRSISMDSFMGNMIFGDDFTRPPPSPQITPVQKFQVNTLNENSAKFSMDFGSSEFSAVEIEKIKANDKLTEMVSSDPKRVKRILANRQSAARSKERKMRYISELEHKVQTLQTEATTLSTQVTLLQRDSTAVINENNELKFRIQALEQEAQLKDALNDALKVEVQRLRLATAGLGQDTQGIADASTFHLQGSLYQSNDAHRSDQLPGSG